MLTTAFERIIYMKINISVHEHKPKLSDESY